MVDQNEFVRNTIEKNILKKFKCDNVIEYFYKNNQLGSLKVCLEEFLEKNKDFVSQNFILFCEKIINGSNQILYNDDDEL